MDAYKPLYNESQLKNMDEQYGKATGPESQEAFDMDKLGENANAQGGGWTMNDEYDAPLEEYGDDRPDADKVSPCRGLSWAKIPRAAQPALKPEAPSPAQGGPTLPSWQGGLRVHACTVCAAPAERMLASMPAPLTGSPSGALLPAVPSSHPSGAGRTCHIGRTMQPEPTIHACMMSACARNGYFAAGPLRTTVYCE